MLFLGISIGLRYIKNVKKHVDEVFWSTTKKQITHSSHVSYSSISLPVTKVLILGIKCSLENETLCLNDIFTCINKG